MFLAGIFLAAFARALASPIPVAIPTSPIPSPLCVVTAALSTGTCDPNKKRTIFDILYSCLGVIFLCTYISIHHNIPDQSDSWVKKMWSKIRTMLYAMVAPEIVIMWALRQRIVAGAIADWHKGLLVDLAHIVDGLIMFEKNMDGRTLTVSLLRCGLMVESERKGNYNVVVWRNYQLCINRDGGVYGPGAGTSWFVVQCIARHIEGLALTELELVTLAFAALNAMTYILWWDKPLNVEYPIYFDLDGNRVDGPEEKEDEAWYKELWKMVTGNRSGGGCGDEEGFRQNAERRAMNPLWQDIITKPFVFVFGPLLEMTNLERVGRATSVHPFYAATLGGDKHRIAYLCASIIGLVFGGIHLVGWSIPVSTTELWLWRASSLVLTVVPAIIAISWPLKVDWWRVEYNDPFTHRVLWFVVTRIGVPLYVAARLIVLFLAFFSLRDLPDSAFDNIQWSNHSTYMNMVCTLASSIIVNISRCK
ncbi:hypothetical protein AX16_001828 [Volvariella volvacea WC 439]|nr:hypothetical protein AX16_001828 [Volvariella volvacea WC 439]